MTLTILKSKLSKYWIFIFFGGFFVLFVLLYLAFNPTKTTQPKSESQVSIPQNSIPENNPFVNKPQKYQITNDVQSFSVPTQTFSLTVTNIPADITKIAQVFDFNPTDFKELLTDIGPRKIFIDQNRTLGIDNLSITYRNPQNKSGTNDLNSIKLLAKNILQSISQKTTLNLSEPEFYSSTSMSDQPIKSFQESDIVIFKILTTVNNLALGTDKTPDISVGTISFDHSGNVLGFNLVTTDYIIKDTISLIPAESAIAKLINNQSSVIQTQKLSGTKTEEEDFQVINYKSIKIDTVEVAYFFPTTKNAQTVFPFYIFSGIATSNNDQEYKISLTVEAVTN